MAAKKKEAVLDEDAMRKVAAFAGVDPRTVRRVVLGAAARSRVTVDAIVRALRDLGWAKVARAIERRARSVRRAA